MPTPKPLSAFQFYPGTWLTNVDIALMSAEEEGTYIRLLAHQWLSVSLPKDEKSLQKLTKLKPRAFTKVWSVLSIHFPLTAEGTERQNPTLFALFQEREAYKEQMQKNGRHGGRPKNQKVNQTETNRLAEHNQTESSVSVSVSNSFKKAEGSVLLTSAPAPAKPSGVSNVFGDISPCVAPAGHDALATLLGAVAHPGTWAGIIRGCASGQSMPQARPASPERLAAAVQDFVAAGHHLAQPAKASLFRGFVGNAKASAAQTRQWLDVNADKADELLTIRRQNLRRLARQEPPRPEPTWAAEIDAMYPDGRTHPAGVAA